MTLKDKNGKPYRSFSQPNPLLLNQEPLQKEELVFHNFDWKPIVDEPHSVSEPVIRQPEPDLTPPPKKVAPMPDNSAEVNDFLELLKKESASLKKEKPPEPPKPKSKEHDLLIETHCWPAVIREQSDDLYGEKRRTIQYGKKFNFDSLIVNSTDFDICLFTRDSTITRGSVVYPSKYKNINERLDYLRWWQVVQIEQFRDGYLIYGEITNQQADFSD